MDAAGRTSAATWGTAAADALDRFDLRIDERLRRVYYENGWWRKETVVDDFKRSVERFGDKPAVVTYRADSEGAEIVTYGQLAGHVRRIAKALQELGVGRGDIVSVQLPNWWQFVPIALGAMTVGAALNPIVPIHRRRELEQILTLLQSKVLVVPKYFRGFDHAALARELQGEVEGLKHVIVVGAEPGDWYLSFESDLLGGSSGTDVGWAEVEVDPDGLADVQFTSGTTGEPKGVGHTHNTQYARARALYETLELTSDDVVFMPMTLAHSTGLVYGVITAIMNGMTLVLQDVWEPKKALGVIAREGVTWSFATTTFLVDLIRAHRESGRAIPSLRYFVSGGASIPPAVVDEAMSELGTRVMAVWGMSENGAVTCTRPSDPVSAASRSDGRACPWMEMKIVDEAGGPVVEEGAPGVLKVRGASQMVGYIKRPDLTAAAFDEEGWFDTGDIARIDANGELRITGRVKDLIIRGGENIPVAEIEALLYGHPAIDEVAVVAYPDERLGERACAVVVPRPGVQIALRDITRYLELAGMSKTYWPERLEVVSEMPVTQSGKIQKSRLREMVGKTAATRRTER